MEMGIRLTLGRSFQAIPGKLVSRSFEIAKGKLCSTNFAHLSFTIDRPLV